MPQYKFFKLVGVTKVHIFYMTPWSFFVHFCPGMITIQAESINSDLQHGLDRRLQHTQH